MKEREERDRKKGRGRPTERVVDRADPATPAGDARDEDAELRFLVVGPLLKQPFERGALRRRLEELSQETWHHPKTGLPHRFGVSTIERWYHAARRSPQPLQALRRRLRKDRDCSRRLTEAACNFLRRQYQRHPHFTPQLHCDNLHAAIASDPSLGPAISVSTVRRFLEREGLFKRRRRKADTEGARRARDRFEHFEVRSYEHDHIGALWHLDFHIGSRSVQVHPGVRQRPVLFGVMDDCSRFVPHLQWYLAEEARTLVHGLCQALQKQGLPRELMMDRGAAMAAAETRAGLLALGIVASYTLPYSPHQNGKQEHFWNQIERRLLAMLDADSSADLTLARLNEITQVWLHADYHARVHSELGESPLDRLRSAPSVLRPHPGSDALRRAFRRQETRTQRRSDGTVSVAGTRFEVPSAFGHLRKLTIRYASFDLREVDLVDEVTGTAMARLHPLDRVRNAEGRRRRRGRVTLDSSAAGELASSPAEPAGATLASSTSGLPPLLARMLDLAKDQRLPPSYVPLSDDPESAR